MYKRKTETIFKGTRFFEKTFENLKIFDEFVPFGSTEKEYLWKIM